MHLTVRMAWHDNKWNGKVCNDPEANNYCTGAHSLLSSRIEKRKNTGLESSKGVRGEYVARGLSANNVPPCYWSINAFSDQSFGVEHTHPFSKLPRPIPDVVRTNSVITWPFKLSFVHDKQAREKRYGSYWPDLEQRIDNYIKKFTPNESILFFYTNFDNPVSADDMKYLLVGCSVISELPTKQHFSFSSSELEEIRRPKKKKDGTTNIKMLNFPTMNWMLQFSHDPVKAVVIPYHEYLAFIETNPGAEELLDEVKVIIEEQSLIKGFKYVSMDIDDDKCLYLLYKLRKSIKQIQAHNQQVIKRDLLEEEERINELIKRTWAKRGIYPSLARVLDVFVQNREVSEPLAIAIANKLTPKYDLADFFTDTIGKKFPDDLEEFEDDLLDLADDRNFKKHHRALAKLSLFTLTSHQIKRIINNKELLTEVEVNPYALYEEYEPEEDDLDIPDMQDEIIDVYKVDLGMIPDRKYVKRHRALQNLKEDSPERVRSEIINYLWAIGENGHCFDSAKEVVSHLYAHPLIYKNDIELDDEAILNLDSDYKSHFIQKLRITETPESNYFYLDVVKDSEVLIKSMINKLINRPNHTLKKINVARHIGHSLAELKPVIKTSEQKKQFSDERKRLYTNIFAKSLFLLTGRPGSGKTYETAKIIEHLYKSGEEVVVLAPTGKAVLRITENIKTHTSLTDVEARTIDKFIFDNKFGDLYDDWLATFSVPPQEKVTVENLIVDESSMLDLKKFTFLLSIIKFSDRYPKRVILVGDENQLPPIGFGKPFHDTIEYTQQSDKYATSHYINLISNCRQENDENILKLAEAFTDKTRGYEEAFNLIDSGEGKKSKGLFVYEWRNKEQLNAKIDGALNRVFDFEEVEKDEDLSNGFEKLNILFGLYGSGYVNNQDFEFVKTLKLETMQLLTPYRTGYSGTLGLNRFIQSNYRYRDMRDDHYFNHADKLIRLWNWYWGKEKNSRLELSNGSIGVVTVGKERKYYFKDRDRPILYIDDEENFDLAYAITVHKSQGSDFKNVLLVIPQKRSLLSKELLYTALTRSKYRLFIFMQSSEENLLMKAKNNSHLLHRNTSIFMEPVDQKGRYFPEPGKEVASKIEFIIYKALQKSGLKFIHEEPLKLAKRNYKIRPDFTIFLRGGKKIFWEHLGMLDTRKYYNDWLTRRRDYAEHSLEEALVTTDDLNGVSDEKIATLIEHIRDLKLDVTPGNKFSNHHYELY